MNRAIKVAKGMWPNAPSNKANWKVHLAYFIIKSRREGGLSKEDHTRFVNIVTTHIGQVKDMTCRWQISITDTMGEYGEIGNLVTSAIWMMEKLANPRNKGKGIRVNKRNPDVHIYMRRRLKKFMTPIEYELFNNIWVRLAHNPATTVGNFYTVCKRTPEKENI